MGEENIDYKEKYFEEKFDRVFNELGEIKQGVKKTNGSVARAFKEINEIREQHNLCNIGSVEKKVDILMEETSTARYFGRNKGVAVTVATAFLVSIFLNVALIFKQMQVIIDDKPKQPKVETIK